MRSSSGAQDDLCTEQQGLPLLMEGEGVNRTDTGNGGEMWVSIDSEKLEKSNVATPVATEPLSTSLDTSSLEPTFLAQTQINKQSWNRARLKTAPYKKSLRLPPTLDSKLEGAARPQLQRSRDNPY